MSADIVAPEVRSRMMAGIGGRHTRPERVIRSALHRRGFRYRLHARSLPGKPDLAFPARKAVIFVHGCFWHGHDCHLFKWPKTRADFWRNKIDGNVERDRQHLSALLDAGWRVAVVWECAMKGRTRLPTESVVETCARWLDSTARELTVRGQ